MINDLVQRVHNPKINTTNFPSLLRNGPVITVLAEARLRQTERGGHYSRYFGYVCYGLKWRWSCESECLSLGHSRHPNRAALSFTQVTRETSPKK